MNERAKFSVVGGRDYQEKIVQAIIQDHEFAEQMTDVLDPSFFDQSYLSAIVDKFFKYRSKYNAYPSVDVIENIMKNEMKRNMLDESTYAKSSSFFKDSATKPLNGDMRYIQDTSLDFCKKQTLIEALQESLSHIEHGSYDSIATTIRSALNKGDSRDLGHDYLDGFAIRGERINRKPIKTPWEGLNKLLNGGTERGTLSTIIAPTGAGKTHALCNFSAGGIVNGYNVAYVTLEIAQQIVGIRHDACLSEMKINDVPDHIGRVEKEVKEKVKGRLFIKEFPTKRATVQTIRTYLMRLQSMRDFSPDILVIDYADLLRSMRDGKEKRYELESVYEDLRGLAQEFNMSVITADQTNRAGLNQEVVTLDSIAECYAKATVCDLIMTISRTNEDKVNNTGKLFIAKSRFGYDGIVIPFKMDPARVKIELLQESQNSANFFEETSKSTKEALKERVKSFRESKKNSEDNDR